MPLPSDYEQLIEGQPLAGGATYAGFTAGLHLQPGWQNEFGQHRCFRVVGMAHAIAWAKIPFYMVKDVDEKGLAAMIAMMPSMWIDGYFSKKDWHELRAQQVKDAYRGALQRFDKAAASLTYVRAGYVRLGGAEADFDALVRIRPITYYIDGFDRIFPMVEIAPGALDALRDATGQDDGVFSEKAKGVTFVSRKTAETGLATLVALEAAGKLPAGTTSSLTVQCGVLARRRRKRVWSAKTERIWYAPTEYLSPFAWSALASLDQAAVAAPPLPRHLWQRVA